MSNSVKNFPVGVREQLDVAGLMMEIVAYVKDRIHAEDKPT